MRLAVLLALSITASGCLGSTSSERRNRGLACVAGGVAVAVLGGYIVSESSGPDDGLETLPQGLAGTALIGVGLTTVGFGGANLVSALAMSVERSPAGPVERQEVTPPPPETDRTACVTWRANRDQERDPARRAALDAARPAHCRVAASGAR